VSERQTGTTCNDSGDESLTSLDMSPTIISSVGHLSVYDHTMRVGKYPHRESKLAANHPGP
jgi:hypothetical protein